MTKSAYSKSAIANFLNDKYRQVISLKPVTEGMESQVYSFQLADKSYVVRINSSPEGFEKDAYAFQHFYSNSIPIPAVIEYGRFSQTHYYCISAKASGITFEDIPAHVVEQLLPDITQVLIAIGETDISSTNGYGVFDGETGNAPFASWQDYLLDILGPNYDWGVVKNLELVDAGLVDQLIATFKNLVPLCGNPRKLWHGDFGSNNIIVDGTPSISGVIDWDCAGYGDPLYDVATAYFWRTWLMCMDKTSQYYEAIFGNQPNYQAKILCYQLHIGLKELLENVMDQDWENLQWIQNRCREIIV